MFRYAIAVPGLAALLGSAAMPGQAATAIGQGDAQARFSLVLAEGSTLTSSFTTETLESFEDQDGSGTATASAETQVEDDLTLASTDEATAGPGIGSGLALTSVLGTIDVSNPEGAEAGTFGFSLGWSLNALAESDSPFAFATGAAAITLLGPDGGTLFERSLAFGEGGDYGSDSLEDVFALSIDDGFVLAGGETASFQIRTDASASASVIPVPAALPLLLTAFGGLVALRRFKRHDA
ncbi:VPLPA-CTERM sorting domain-containing protein [Rhodobaculum claviforme]|uniref:VPLPA-CTERM protein sorting domain-containing protein n=1 Tax=Rhodobaculum claviforme TaxID=1549854 RepID=A0A934TJJ2_9RHOB|nr:VPLPA-CTERM sorting domain-containing protein [Rhodobaculum claviforme]MBK5926783.1 hypothetical protein [Rhodobaculum claviforme]